jgi:lipid-binding SYLF domain-containing protein
MASTRRQFLIAPAAIAAAASFALPAEAETASQLIGNANQALAKLYATEPKAVELSKRAVGILVFPSILKAGLIVGGQGGDGVLRERGRVTAYYNIAAASFGLQAGAQTFSYALFFMNTKALSYLHKSDGWSIGTGPSVVVLDKGAAASLNSTTLTQDVYAFPFGQTGLMAGLSLEGSKITRIHLS